MCFNFYSFSLFPWCIWPLRIRSFLIRILTKSTFCSWGSKLTRIRFVTNRHCLNYPTSVINAPTVWFFRWIIKLNNITIGFFQYIVNRVHRIVKFNLGWTVLIICVKFLINLTWLKHIKRFSEICPVNHRINSVFGTHSLIRVNKRL